MINCGPSSSHYWSLSLFFTSQEDNATIKKQQTYHMIWNILKGIAVHSSQFMKLPVKQALVILSSVSGHLSHICVYLCSCLRTRTTFFAELVPMNARQA